MILSSQQLARVSNLYNQGYYIQAYRFAQSIGPLTEWEGTAAMLIAGRLAANLGGQRLGRYLLSKAYRLDSGDGQAAYYKARAVYEKSGPLASWRFLRRTGETVNGAVAVQADWLAFHAIVLGALRDFDTAAQWIKKAEIVDPNNAWIWIERSHLFELEDKYEEALSAARHSLDLHPYFRPGVQAVAHVLVLLGRDNEALNILEQSVSKIESCGLAAQLAQLQTELGQHEKARQSLERFAELAPLREQDSEQWLNAQRADTAYLCGEFNTALQYTQLSESSFHKLVVERMRTAAADAKRVLLPLGFVRQHHMTCAPATLTLISRFWQMATDQLSVVEAICYDGTPARSERDWAETHGWFAREFCVTWEDTVTLIDRGVPFTLTTVDPGNAHQQAVIGYDSRRGTILVRDPYVRNLVEYSAQEMFQRYRSSGPRGMAMVPLAQKHLLEDLELHEAHLYDGLYRVQQALYIHDRNHADELTKAMASMNENHRLTCQAQLSIAEYDCDDARVLLCLENILSLFPDDANLWVYKLSVLRRMARRQERLELLNSICNGKQTHPLFWQMYASELSDDGRQHARVLRLLRRALRYGPADAQNYYLLASHLWSQQRFAEAKELYRFAACLRDTNEDYVRSYFIASCHFHEQAEAFGFLQSRFDRFGKRSSYPARTLAWAYEQTGQEPSALAIVKQGLDRRPEDGDFMLYAADLLARVGQFDGAEMWLQRAQGLARRVDCLQTRAVIAGYHGDAAARLTLWRQVADAEPLNIMATRNIAQICAETEGEVSSVSFLREQIARFPHNLAFHRLLVERLKVQQADNDDALLAMIDVDPLNAWARRERALALTLKRDYREALVQAELAQQLEPMHPDSFNVLARIHEESGNIEEAKAAYRRAINLSADNEYAIGNLIAISRSVAERRAALHFIKEELIRQVIFGDGLMAYREYARNTLDGDELRELLQAALKARPDLWHAWSALISQLTDQQQYDAALELARRATERFPLVPRIWLNLAVLQRARVDRQGEIDALKKALEISSSWGLAARQLAEAYMYCGELQKARKVLDQTIAQAPLDCENHALLADLLWRVGEKEGAVDRLKRALTLEPGYNWAWARLRAWSSELKREHDAIAFVREMAARRSGEPRSWLLIAETLNRPEDLPERLQALDRANEMNPRLVEAHVLRAKLLTQAKRYDEARAACRPEIFGGELPIPLRGAAAVIEAENYNSVLALELMNSIVAEDPNNYEAWTQMADWTANVYGRQDDNLRAANELVRILPNSAVSWGYLGAARRFNIDHPGAKEAFKRALALSPNYDFGAFSLFDLQLNDGEIDAAKKTLELLKLHVRGDWVIERELEFAVKAKDAVTAARLFRYLCQETAAERGVIEQAIKPMYWNDMEEQVESILDECLEISTANPVVGEVWADRWIERGNHDHCRKRLESCAERTAVWTRAAAHYLEKKPPTERSAETFQFMQDNSAILHADDNTWGLGGYALYEFGRYQEVVEWCSDWRSRTSVKPWMLWNYVLALRELKRDAEAYEVGQAALILAPDDLYDDHRVMIALHDALSNEAHKAAERLRQIRYDGLRGWTKFNYNTAVILVRASSTSASKLIELGELAGLRRDNPFFWKDRLLFAFHWRGTLRIAEWSNNVLVKLWAYWLLGRLYLKNSFVSAQESPAWSSFRMWTGT